MKVTNFIPSNNAEKLLLTLPKKCACAMCEATKSNVKSQLGETKYESICKTLGLLIY